MSVWPSSTFSKPSPGAMIDQAHSLSRGLVGCWLLGDGGGSGIADISTGNARGTGSAFTAVQWVGSHHGGLACKFDGTDDVYDLGSRNYLSASRPFSLCFWVIITTIDTNFRGIVQLRKDDGSGWAIATYSTALSDGLTFGESSDSAGQFVLPAPVTGGWHFVTLVYDGSGDLGVTGAYRAFADGVEKTVSSTAAYGALTQINSIGKATAYSYHSGVIEGVRLYERMLRLEDHQLLYAEPYAGITMNNGFAFVAAAGGGATIPIFDHHYRMQRAA